MSNSTPQPGSSDAAIAAAARQAAGALRVPILLVSVAADGRQRLDCQVGLQPAQFAPAIAICEYTAHEDSPLMLGNTLLDDRFAADPLVLTHPPIRAMLGVKLQDRGGRVIGTVCALDHVVRDFNASHTQALSDFAITFEGLLQLRELASQTAAELNRARQQERMYRSTFEESAVGIAQTSRDGELLRANRRLCQMLGYTPDELRSMSFIDITHGDDIEENIRLFRSMVAGEIDSYRMEKRFLCKGGECLWAHLSVALVRTDGGAPDYMISMVQDISERKRLEQELIRVRDDLQEEARQQARRLEENNLSLRAQVKRALESERVLREAQLRLQTITDSIPALIGYWNQELRCEFANQAYFDWFGIDPRRIVGMHLRELVGERIFTLNEPYALAALAGREQRFRRDLAKADGSAVHVEAHYLPDRDEAGHVRGFFVQVTDITGLRQAQVELETANAELRIDSQTDYLTGLSNRRVFSERSREAHFNLRRGGEAYGLVLLDLDDFKLINDEHGHDVGDDVLRSVGRVLREFPRGTGDVAARLGGEEFAMLCLGELTEAKLRQIAERLRVELGSLRIPAGSGVLQISGSFGVALASPWDTNWKNIYARADQALYEAKQTGKNQVIVGKGA